MAGTTAGGKKLAARMKKVNPNFYREAGSAGGKAPHRYPRGFAAMSPERVREIGAKGGRNGKRGPNKPKFPVENPEALKILDKALQEEAAVVSY